MNRYLTKVALIASLFTVVNAYASLNGFYLGGQLGYGSIYNSPTSNVISFTTGGTGGLAGRLFGGYQFTPHWAAEFGYTKFSNTTVRYFIIDPLGSGDVFAAEGNVASYALDLVGKLTFPMPHGISFWGKFGIAGINENAGKLLFLDPLGNGGFLSINKNAVMPTFGLGLAYDLDTNLAADFSWMHIQHIEHFDIQSTNLITLGINYYFG